MARSEAGGGDNRSENVSNDFISLCFYFYSCGVDFVIPLYLERFYKYIFIVVLCVNRLKHSGLTKPEFEDFWPFSQSKPAIPCTCMNINEEVQYRDPPTRSHDTHA